MLEQEQKSKSGIENEKILEIKNQIKDAQKEQFGAFDSNNDEGAKKKEAEKRMTRRLLLE